MLISVIFYFIFTILTNKIFVQRGNAAPILSSLPAEEKLDDIFYL